MKQKLLYPATFFMLVYLLWYFFYPETLASIEADSFFVFTHDYFFQKLSQPAGLSGLLGDFLSQFYRWLEIAALLQALFGALILAFGFYLIAAIGNKRNGWIALLPASLFVCLQLQWVYVVYSVQYLIFVGAITFYVAIQSSIRKSVILLLLIPLFILLLPVGTVIFLYIMFILLEFYFFDRKKMSIFFLFLCFIIIILIPSWWSNYLYFIPQDKKYYFHLLPSIPVYLLYLLPIPLFIVTGFFKIRNRKVKIFFSAMIIMGISAYMILNPTAQRREKLTAVENYAMAGDWKRLLNRLSPEDARQDAFLMRYVLLALAAQESMTRHLFDISPSSPDCFYFYHTKEPLRQRFNSLFYASLGLYNEAIRQSFEAALQNENGTTFRAIRQMIDWYLKMGNAPLADKYLTLLDFSSCHRSWIKKRRVLLEALKEKSPVTPDKSMRDIFIGSYPFTHEMSLLVEEDAANRRKADYLLCALLLEKRVETFIEILSTLPAIDKSDLPLCYQQALLIAASGSPEFLSSFQLSEQQYASYQEFIELLAGKHDDILAIRFRNTYWFYYYK